MTAANHSVKNIDGETGTHLVDLSEGSQANIIVWLVHEVGVVRVEAGEHASQLS